MEEGVDQGMGFDPVYYQSGSGLVCFWAQGNIGGLDQGNGCLFLDLELDSFCFSKNISPRTIVVKSEFPGT